jgi:hypothetical protein
VSDVDVATPNGASSPSTWGRSIALPTVGGDTVAAVDAASELVGAERDRADRGEGQRDSNASAARGKWIRKRFRRRLSAAAAVGGLDRGEVLLRRLDPTLVGALYDIDALVQAGEMP